MQTRWLVLAIVGASSAGAEPAEPAEAAEPVELSIWYRSSDQCPTAEVFLERLSRLGRPGRLARAGDRIDFVVTLDSVESGSFGRLERQAEQGTIAIREVEAPKCEEVAEALALSLDLAVDPMQEPGAPGAIAEEKGVIHPARAPVAAPPDSDPRQSPSVARVDDQLLPETTTPSDSTTEEAAAVGVQALLLTGIAPDPMFGGAVFGELALPLGISARLSGYAAWAASTVEEADLEHQLFAARLEGCSPRLSLADLRLTGCVGVDGGLLRAAYSGPTGSADSGPWGAATLLGRAGWRVSAALTLELQAGVMLPWVRYETGDPEATPLASGDAVVVTAGLGASYAFGGGSHPAKSARSQVSSRQTAGR